MIKKIISVLVITLFLLVSLSAIYFKKYTSNDGTFSFYYPRSWVVTSINGLYFSGIVVSDRAITDNSNDYSAGGFIEINLNNIQTSKTNIKDYISEQKNLKTPLVVPGPSQFEYAGAKSINGFEQVYSNRALSDSLNSKLYWKIGNNKLFEVYTLLPNNNSNPDFFQFVSKIIISFFKINAR